MTALLKQPAAPTIARDWSMLVPIGQAAKAMQISDGQLRRRCGTELAARGLAFQLKPPTGGNVSWFIDRRADQRLAPGRIGDMFRVPNLKRFRQDKVDRAHEKISCVMRLRELRGGGNVMLKDAEATLIENLRHQFPLLRISRTTLYAWDAAYKVPCDTIELIDQRGGDKSAHTPAWNRFEQLYLLERPNSSIKHCYLAVRAEAAVNGWIWPSLRSVERALGRMIPPQKQAYHRDRKLYKSHFAPGIAQDPESWSAGELWIGDHCQLDFWCRAGKAGNLVRPWLTAWMDWRTRKVVGWILSTAPNSGTILAAFRTAALDSANRGIPRSVKIDNGKDYDCFMFHGQTKQQRLGKWKQQEHEPAFTGLFNMLTPPIQVSFAIPHNPDGKSRIERWFGTVHTQFDQQWDTYCGRSPDNRPVNLQKALENPAVVPSFEKVMDAFIKYVADYHRNADNSIECLVDEHGRQLSPGGAYAAWHTTPRIPADPAALDLFLRAWAMPTTAGKKGVSVQVGSRTYHYGAFATELIPFKAAKKPDRTTLLVSYDPEDMGVAHVYDEHRQYICTVQQNELGGAHVSKDQLSTAMKLKTRYNSSHKFIHENPTLGYASTAELAIGIARQEAQAPLPSEPSSFGIVRSPIDGQTKHIQRGQLRQAAGAEVHEPIPLMSSLLARDDEEDESPRRSGGMLSLQSLISNTTNEQ